MTKIEISKILEELEKTKERSIVVIDFSNVIHWQNDLGQKQLLKRRK